MVCQLKKIQTNKRPQAFWGSLIPSALSFVGGLITSSQQAKAQRRALEEQQRLAKQQLDISNQNQLASTLNNYVIAQQSYDDKDYNLKYRIGGIKRLGSRNIMITDGGNAKRIGNNTYLLRGGSHEDINETGQTGIGINVGGNEIEAEGGEVAQRKGNSLRIYSAQPILGGISPAEAIIRGYNKDRVFNAQQAFKKRNGLKDDGSKAAFGNLITMPFAGIIKDVIDYFSESGKYAPKRVKVSNKTVNRKPIRNGQVGNFRVVNGKYFPNEKPLRQVYPEFDIISMGRGLPIKRILKNIVGFVQKPNTFTRGIGNREGIKDLVESKVVRGNPVGTEMTARAYTKATKSNRNSFNDIMNGTGREGISHRYYNRSLSKEDFDAIRESYNKINASFKARHPKASGKIRFAIRDDVYDPLGNYKNYDDYLAQIASDRKTLRNATTINPDNGEPIAYFYDDGRNPLTQGHGYASSKWGVRISNPQDYNMKIFDGHLHYSNSKTIPFDSPNVEVFRSTPFGIIRYPKWMLRRGWYRNGGLTSKDRGSSKHPTFSNESIYSNKKHTGGTWNGNVFVPNIWQFGNDGNKARNKYMNNSGEGYFNGRVNIFPKYRKRIAKRMGSLTNPPVERFKCGGRIRPKAEDGMLATIYSYGTNRRRLPSFAPIDVTPRAIPNFKPVSIPTNAKIPFDPNSVPYLGKQSSFKPVTQDYIGLGIDTLAALGSGMFTRSAYNKMNFDYALPNYVDESPVAFDTTYHNEAQRANIERNRLNARNLIRGNTASAQTALGRMQQSDVDAMMETNKLLDEKSNKEVELRNQNAANEQQVRARNAAARNQYYQNVAQIKNAALEAKNNAELAKAQSIGADLSGLSQAWTNFAGSVESRYDNRQKEAIIAATAKDPAVLSNAVQFGYNFSPEVLAAIYNSTDDDNLKSLALSQLSTKNRLRYGIR